MEYPILNPSERYEMSGQSEPQEAAQGFGFSVHHPSQQLFSMAETATASVGPDEVLVPDARGRLSPVQMVEQKLLDVLGCGHPGLFRQATGRPGNIRMMPGQ